MTEIFLGERELRGQARQLKKKQLYIQLKISLKMSIGNKDTIIVFLENLDKTQVDLIEW